MRSHYSLLCFAATVAAAALAHAQDRMYFTGYGTASSAIRSANLDGTGVQVLVPPFGGRSGIAIDSIARKMYWTEISQQISIQVAVRRADLSGANVETIATMYGYRFVGGIAVDASAGKVYWAAGSLIQRSNLDGSNVEFVVGDSGLMRAIALDNAGRIFWTNHYIYEIKSANLDGSNVRTVLATGDRALGIAIDCVARQMYWTEGTDIRRANLDGSNAQTIVTGWGSPFAIAVERRDGKLYWSDAQSVQRSNLDGSNVQGLVLGVDSIWGIAIDLPACNASWDSYGAGWPGSNGRVPVLRPLGDPVLGCSLTVNLSNTVGVTSAGVLIVGSAAASVPTPFGGTLLVSPATVVGLNVPWTGLPIALPVPVGQFLCGTAIYLQAAQADAGASHGVAFTAGLRLLLGY